MIKSFSRNLFVCLLLSLAFSACSSPASLPTATTLLPAATIAPTSEPTLTSMPPTATVPPTSTRIPPTATSLPTVTPVPPTNTPLHTATSIPPTSTSAPKATPTRPATKVASSQGSPSVVSAQPSNVLKSIQQAVNTAQVLTGQINTLIQGDTALCAPMLQSFNSLINAPTYDVGTQPSNVQQAYSLYRGAIDQLNAQAAVLRACGASGKGTINSIDLGLVHSKVGDAANQLARAWSLVQDEASVSSAGPAAPLLAAIRQVMYDADALNGLKNRMAAMQGWFQTWPFPAPISAFPCSDYITIYDRIVNAPSFDVSAQSLAAQAAYSKYRAGVAAMMDGGKGIFDVCSLPQGLIVNEVVKRLIQSAATAHELFSQAIQLLSQ